MTPLEVEIRRRIAAAGPMPVGEYMALCLGDPQHGYYMTRDPFGARGDFITAPEISQMFGELIGLWMVAVWRQMGAPENINIIELGPGRGTLMSDALRAGQQMASFREAIAVHLVEISPVLRVRQQRALGGYPASWHASLHDVPNGPAIIIANEFFDALPINQAVKVGGQWYERQVEIDVLDELAFTCAHVPLAQFDRLLPAAIHAAPNGAIFEWRDDGVAMAIGRRIANDGGAALVIDYGHIDSGVGETLQAVGQHAFADPLRAPGSLDLTAHVDFAALKRAMEAMGATGHGPIEQADFLLCLGIEARAAALKAKASHAGVDAINAALGRLLGTGHTEMGALFKVVAFTHPSIGAPPGFES